MAHPVTDDRHGMRRLKSNAHEVNVEDEPWDSASTADNNTPMGPVFAVSVATSNPVNNSSSA